MKFGKSLAQKMFEEQADIIAKINGVRRFAYFPTKLKSGHYIWLSEYWAYYSGGKEPGGAYFLWSRSPDSYSPYYKSYDKADPSFINITEIH